MKAKGEKRALEICRSGKIYETVYPGALCSEKNYLLDVNCLSLDPGHIYVSDEIYYFVIVRD